MAKYRQLMVHNGTGWHLMSPNNAWEALRIAWLLWRHPDRVATLVGVSQEYTLANWRPHPKCDEACFHKGVDGKEVRYVYDYVADKAVPEAQMPFGSARHAASERAKHLLYPPRNALQCAARACPGCAVCSKTPNGLVTGCRRQSG